jgi:multidrug efflux system membrane fusion protein
MKGTLEIDGGSKLDIADESELTNMESDYRSGPSNASAPRRWIFPVVALFVVCAFSAWIFGSNHPSSHKAERKIPETSRLAPTNGSEVLVRVYTVPDPMKDRRSLRSLVGSLQPRYQSPLGFRIGGKVIARHAETGDRVVQGQVLMQLDPVDAVLQVEVADSDWNAAKSQLALVEAEANRLRPLLSNGSASKSEYDVATAARDTARARLDAAERRKRLAENQREYCELKADRDGLVTSVIAEIGQVVAAGQPVMQWMQGDELEAAVSVPESMHREIRNLKAEVTFWSRPGVTLQGRLRELSPIANPPSRMYDARFELIDPPADLALGMTATVHLTDSEMVGIPIPMSALAQRDGQPVVWRVQDDGSLQSVGVSIVRYETEHAIIRGNLYQGDQLVSAGVQKLDPECRVRVWKDDR